MQMNFFAYAKKFKKKLSSGYQRFPDKSSFQIFLSQRALEKDTEFIIDTNVRNET